METEKLGEYAFLAGVLIAIVAGLAGPSAAPYGGVVALALVALGILVGILNIPNKEATNFLVAVVAIAVAGTANFSVIAYVGAYADAIVKYIASFVMPAAIIVALKAIYDLAAKK